MYVCVCVIECVCDETVTCVTILSHSVTGHLIKIVCAYVSVCVSQFN